MEMKKILIILLMSLLCCSAAACGKKENKDTKPSTNTENRTDVEDRMENTPQFFDLNLKLNYTFILHDHIKLQLNAGVQNIFNSFQKDLDKGEFRDSGYFYGPTQPRTYFIGVKITN